LYTCLSVIFYYTANAHHGIKIEYEIKIVVHDDIAFLFGFMMFIGESLNRELKLPRCEKINNQKEEKTPP